MIPIRIALTGFMSYRDTQELLFDGSPLWVLTGENGAGKSAVFDAITLVLFDTFRDRKQHLEDLINQSCDRMEVEFDFSVGVDIYRVRAVYARKNPRKIRLAFRLLPGKDGEVWQEIPLAEESKSEANFDQWIKLLIGLDYNSFTASVLLMQGHSDRLLQVPPEKRRAILASLIDISRYEQLASLAEKHHTDHKISRDRLQTSLTEMPFVDDEQLETAREKEQAARAELEEAQEEVNRLSKLLTQAREWGRLNEDLQKEQARLEHVANLLEREREIREGYSRLIHLNIILPSLEEIVELKGRFSDSNQELHKLDAERQRLEKAVKSAQQEADAAQKEADELRQEAGRLMQVILEHANRLSELAPLAEKHQLVITHGNGPQVGVLALQSAACGLLIYPERKGQKSGQIDPGVAILDAAGLIVFLVPGLVAFGVDFVGGCIYLPGGGKRAPGRHCPKDQHGAEIRRRPGRYPARAPPPRRGWRTGVCAAAHRPGAAQPRAARHHLPSAGSRQIPVTRAPAAAAPGRAAEAARRVAATDRRPVHSCVLAGRLRAHARLG